MLKIKSTVFIVMTLVLILSAIATAAAGEKLLFSFEKDTEGWGIPDWVLEKDEYVAQGAEVCRDYSNAGKSSLRLIGDFPGRKWTAVYVEIEEYFDWTPYEKISLDVYLPQTAPIGLTGKIILTVGDDWLWTEMSRKVTLKPGEWTTLTANLMPGSVDWRRTTVTDSFRADVRKMGVRIESNKSSVYQGPIYIDNVRLITSD